MAIELGIGESVGIVDPTEPERITPGFDQDTVNLAIEVLEQVRTTLMLSFRFMDSALWRMPFKPAVLPEALATDGVMLYFDPISVLRRFRQSNNELARDMLHCLLHCILRHPFDGSHENSRAWWLACDMAVEEMAREMADVVLPSAEDADRQRSMALIRNDFQGAITPQRLYEAFEAQMERAFIGDSERGRAIEGQEELFLRDSHVLWPRLEDDDAQTKTVEGNASDRSLGQELTEDDGSGESSDEGGSVTEPGDQQADEGSSMQESTDHSQSDEDERDASDAAMDAEEAWEEISKQIQEELETYSRTMGANSDCLMANMSVMNRKSVDYDDFLRRFATMREDIKVNDEEFDYVFYTYGMDMYGDMPLIEPLEYQEVDRVREFVVAIDTSESCSGELVCNFIDRTFQILQESQYWGSDVNVHVIQCDASIREDLKITSMRELAELSQNFKIKGFGGTDFRPVFNYVDDLIEQGEFSDLRGVIYFTDGYGTFPKTCPEYDTAFVFIEDEGQARDVPPWAMKVVLRNDQVQML